MSCVDIRGCRIGEGRPKVILPIVERAEAAILEKAAQFSTLQADCVEWRVDHFDDARTPGAVARCLAKLRVALKDKLLLVTFRTQTEGGQVALSPAEYRQFLELVLDTEAGTWGGVHKAHRKQSFHTTDGGVYGRDYTLTVDLPAMGSRMFRLTPETPRPEAAQASARRAAAARRKAARTQNAKADAAAYNSKK